jgi:hypothetical protein
MLRGRHADTEATARRAERMRAAYIAAIGRPSPFAPETPSLPEWVKRAQAGTLPARVTAPMIRRSVADCRVRPRDAPASDRERDFAIERCPTRTGPFCAGAILDPSQVTIR